MERSALILEHSPWFVLLCLLVGALVAFLLYRRPGPWGKKVNYFLTAFRFVLVSILCFLLVGPILKQFKNRVEKPSVVLAIDNSLSLGEVTDSVALRQDLQRVWDLGTSLADLNHEVEYRSLQSPLEPDNVLSFNHPQTSLNRLLTEIQTDYEGRNLEAVVLFSDGIHNQGLSPVFVPYRFPVHTMGWGDTIPQKDVRIKALHYNKIAYQGNDFMVRAEILNEGFQNQPIQVKIFENGRLLQTKNLNLTSSPQLLETDFRIEAARKGLKDFRVEIQALSDEFTLNNNVRNAYIDIIEGQRKILLAARSPHPDIKAIKSALENNQNYQVDLFISGISNPESQEYDLLILHQLSRLEASRVAVISNMLQAGAPVWHILGSKSNIPRFNSENELLEIIPINLQRDQVTALFNNGFSKFQLSPSLQEMIPRINPLNVPFANYKLSGGAEVLLNQKVGNLGTDNPLLVVMDDGDTKTAVLIGEGIWQWRLQDYDFNQSFRLFDEFVSKLVQYLSTNEDKSRFKVYPVTGEFHINEPVRLETEVYNEIYEETYGHTIDLNLRSSDGQVSSYSYTISEGNSQYRISDLPAGAYSYNASTTVEGDVLTSRGQFSITELQLEFLNLTADHQLLRSLSSKTNGRFFNSNQWDSLNSLLLDQPAQGMIYSEEAFLPLIKWPWAFAILLLLVSTEWFLRKFYGSY